MAHHLPSHSGGKVGAFLIDSDFFAENDDPAVLDDESKAALSSLFIPRFITS